MKTPSLNSPIVHLTNGRGKVVISPLLAAQITHLHKLAGNKEWSGVLFFSPINEDLSNPSNFRAVAEAVYPMDIGTAGYTEYEFTPETVIDMYERYPKADPAGKPKWKMGHIHTHHGMGAYFSGTDDQELKDNANKYAYYLSLVVDFQGTYKCKVAFVAEVKRKISAKHSSGWKVIKQEESELIFAAFDVDVVMSLDAWFTDRSKEVSRLRPEPVTTYYGGYLHDYRNRTPQSVSTPATTNKHTTATLDIITGPNATKIRAKIREALPYLVLKDEKLAKDIKYWTWPEEIAKAYPKDEQKEGWIGWVLQRFNTWFMTHFKVDIIEDMDIEEKLANTVIDVINTFAYNDKHIKKLAEALKLKVTRVHKITPPTDSPKDDLLDDDVKTSLGFVTNRLEYD